MASSAEKCAESQYIDRGPALPIGDKAKCGWCGTPCWNRGCTACPQNFHKSCYYVHLAQARHSLERSCRAGALNRPASIPPKVLEEKELKPFLASIGMTEHLNGLTNAGVHGNKDLVNVDEQTLRSAGIAKVLHRRKILKQIALVAAALYGVTAVEEEPCVLLELNIKRSSVSVKLGLVLKEDRGVVVVQDVLPGGAGVGSGFEPGMLVYKINGVNVTSKEDFMLSISKTASFIATVRPNNTEIPPTTFERLFPTARDGHLVKENFERLSLLGAGASSKVFLVRSKQDKKLYALKALDKRAILSAGTSERPTWQRDLIMRERDMMKQIKWTHAGLVRLHHTFQSRTHLYFVLDYCAGGDLYNYMGTMAGGNLPEPLARYYSAQVYLALRALHKAGVVYRDLKPENILLDEIGNAKLADFGLSRPLAWGDRATTFVGTPEYMAPEMIRGQPYSYAVDWWAFGVVIFNMLTGEHAFGRGSAQAEDIWKEVLSSQPIISSEYSVSAGAKDLIRYLLEKDPALRLEGDVIRRQAWFKDNIDWEGIEKGTAEPPRYVRFSFIPKSAAHRSRGWKRKHMPQPHTQVVGPTRHGDGADSNRDAWRLRGRVQ